MPTVDIDEGLGLGTFKMAFGTSSLAPGEKIDTGFSSVESADLTAVDTNGTTVVTVDTLSDGTVTVQHNATGGGSETVHYQIIGS